MSKLETLYQKCPWPLQNLLVSVEGARLKRRRYDARFFVALEKIRQQGEFDINELHSFQEKSLRTFLKVAYQSPFWKKKFEEFGVNPSADDIFSELQKLPILSKEEVKKEINLFYPENHSREGLIPCHTSGTTGSGLVFHATVQAEQAQWATWWRYRGWHGLSLDTWCGYFGGRSVVSLVQKEPPFWRTNYPGRQVMFSAYHLSDETAKHYIQKLKDSGVEWLHGYPSTLSLLAKYKIEQGLDALPNLKVITTGAESLLPHQKKVMEEAFSVSVREHYGQAEGVANISECPNGRLHVDEDFSFVEFIPVGSDDATFRIVGTNWTNNAFPLLRYDTGDIATLNKETCNCGRPGRIVRQIDGRLEDFVVLPSGARVGRLDHIFKDMMTIRAAQIYQPTPKRIVFRVIKGSEFLVARDQALLVAEARKRLGQEIDIEVEYVEDLPKTRTGKLRFVVSDIAENKISQT